MVDKSIYNESWFTYIAECRDKELYVGITKDVKKRIKEHNTTKKCRYTCFRKPIRLIYKEPCENYNAARKREQEVKKFSRAKKIALVNNFSY